MKRNKYIIFIFLGILVIAFSFPIYHYKKKMLVYHKFGAPINPKENSIYRAPKLDSVFIPSEFNETSRLFYLCKSWGFLKFYHENHITIRPRINTILLDAIDKTMQITDRSEYGKLIEELIHSIQITPLSDQNPYPDIDDYWLINNKWMEDTLCLNDSIKEKLSTIFAKHTGKKNPYIFNKGIMGNVRMEEEDARNGNLRFTEPRVRLLGLFRFWNMINYFYVHKHYMDVDWDEALYQAIPRFLAANSEQEYRLEIYRLMNLLKDTHASYPITIDDVVTGSFRPNFRMMCVNDTFVVVSIRIPEYGDSGIQVGDIVLRVDGKEIHEIRDSHLSFVGGGNYWSEYRFLCNAILSRFDSTTLFTLQRGTEVIERKTKNYKAYDLHMENRKKEIENEKRPLYRWINDSIAYMDLVSATKKNFKKNYEAIRSAQTIILDLRCYPSTDLILPITDAFVPPNSFFAHITYPDTRYPGMVRWQKSTSDNIGSEDYYKGNVILLVNENTASYSEYMTMALQVNPKTKSVGYSSSGADGNYSLFEFPGKVKVLYTGIGIYYPDFTPTFRKGVRIDYVVEPTVKSIQQKKDLIYEAAIQLATSRRV